MPKSLLRWVGLGLLPIVLAACGSAAAAIPAAATPASPSQETPMPTQPPDPSSPPPAQATDAPAGGVIELGLEPSVKQSAADLAARLGIAVDTIASIEARSVVWPDRGVGCPQPGVAYIQVPTEGLFIRLRARGLLYAYHSRAGQAPFYCAQSAGPPAAPGAPSNGTDGT